MVVSTGRASAIRTQRPRNRKELILAAAVEQFWLRGYHSVGMADIAAAVDIGPSALYRHFRNKQALLVTAMNEFLDRAGQMLAAPADRDAFVESMASTSLDCRAFGLLWERESGHLPEEARLATRRRLRELASGLAEAVDAGSGESASDANLRAWAMMSVVASPSHHQVDVDRARFEELMRRSVRAVLTAPLPDPAVDAMAVSGPPAGLTPISRRETLLAAAIRLFSERGYPAVALTDIGDAVGIAGPSVYNHFDSKIDLLATALDRGTGALWLGLQPALAAATGPEDAVRRLVKNYTAFAMGNPDLVGILISEVINLPEDRRHSYRRTQVEYITEWTALLRRERHDLGEPETRILVHAALAVINSLSRIPHLRSRPFLADEVSAMALAVLDLPVEAC
ncbi:TetR/AcrR family transcriptional regulator [Rhodococcus sp. ACT016]|uniref:TetR/AcrR family transcriptional regulator n=1 Tax=Rhodococcus sp. ACT016 TaxID=3134808 RepID=UPI003D2921BA